MTPKDLRVINWLLSQNERLGTRSSDSIDTIVLHCTELPTLQDARRAAEPGVRTRTAEAHYYIDRDGTVFQFVEDDRTAGHVVGHNARTIGIELVNLGRYPSWFDSSHQQPVEPYAAEQIEALIALLWMLRKRYPAIRHLRRHSDLDRRLVPATDDESIQVRRRIDPGPLFPWSQIVSAWNRLERN